MERLTYSAVGWHGVLEALGKFVEGWRPHAMDSEIQYRDSLVSYLRSGSPADARIEPEYRNRGTTTDVWFQWTGVLFKAEVSIEIKLDLVRKTEFDRLVGQLEYLDPKNRRVLLVLIGASDPAFVGRLIEKYREPQLLLAQKTFRIAQVPISKP